MLSKQAKNEMWVATLAYPSHFSVCVMFIFNPADGTASDDVRVRYAQGHCGSHSSWSQQSALEEWGPTTGMSHLRHKRAEEP